MTGDRREGLRGIRGDFMSLACRTLADARGVRHELDGLPRLEDPPRDFGSTARRGSGIPVNVYPGLLLRSTGGQKTTSALCGDPDGATAYCSGSSIKMSSLPSANGSR